MRRTGAIALPVAALALLLLAVFARPVHYHALTVLEVTQQFEITFIQKGTQDRKHCEAVTQRMQRAVQQACAICRLKENLCLEQLDPRQRKLLYGSPVDVPVMRLPTGVIAFKSRTPEIAFQVCQESERQGVHQLRGSVHCVPASFASLAMSLATLGGGAVRASPPNLPAFAGCALLAMVISFLVCLVIVRSQRYHARFTLDQTGTGPQKFHVVPTPRVGGIALAAAIGAGILSIDLVGGVREAVFDGLVMLALAAVPALAGGLGDDLTRRVGVLARLMLTIAAGVLASLMVGATLDRVDLPGVDFLLQWPVFAIAFTAFAVGGVANAVNIIDGYNGLVAGFAILVLAALAIVSYQLGDAVVLLASLIMLGALIGFLVWNFPGGRIFLGDGGAYLLGFWLAELSVLLVVRNPEVSPWFPLALLIYPIFETFFTMYRRKIVMGSSASRADALHFHQLIYRRLTRANSKSAGENSALRRNSKVAPYVWVANALVVIPAVLLWRHTAALVALCVIFCIVYVWLYQRVVHLRAPAWLAASRHPQA